MSQPSLDAACLSCHVCLGPHGRAPLQVYFSSTPLKTFNMRPDTLAAMTCLADVGPHARVLCLDATGGIAAAACAERMGGTGTLACAHAERVPYVLDAMRLLNIARWLAPSARSVALVDLLSANTRIAAAAAPAEPQPTVDVAAATRDAANEAHPSGAAADVVMSNVEPIAAEAEAEPAASAPAAAAAAAEASDSLAERSQDGAAPAARHPAAGVSNGGVGAEGRPAHKTVFRLHESLSEGTRVPDAVIAATDAEVDAIAAGGFTAAVVAAPRLEPALLLQAVLPLLLPSAAVVVYSPALQPLADCFQTLQESKEFASIHVWSLRITVKRLRAACCAPALVRPSQGALRVVTTGLIVAAVWLGLIPSFVLATTA